MSKKSTKPSNGRLADSEVKKFSKAKLDEYIKTKSSRLNDKWLPADLLGVRRKNDAKKAEAKKLQQEIVPNSGLTFGKLRDQEKYSESLAFAGTDRALQDQADQAKANEERDNQWFNNYQAMVAGAKTNAQTAVTNAQTAGTTAIDAQDAAARSQSDKVAQQLRDRAQQLNLGGQDAGAQYQQVAGQAADNRSTELRSQQEANRVRAQGTVENLRASEVGVGQSRTDAGSQYRAKEKSLAQTKLDLEGKKASWRQDYLDKTIAAATQRVQEAAVYAATLDKNSNDYDLALKKLQQSIKYQEGMLGVAQTNAAANTTRANKYDGGSGGGKKNKVPRATAPGIQTVTGQLSSLLGTSGMIRAAQRSFLKKNKRPANWTDTRNSVSNAIANMTGTKPPAWLVDIAIEQERWHGISKGNIQLLHKNGYKLADFPYLKKRK